MRTFICGCVLIIISGCSGNVESDSLNSIDPDESNEELIEDQSENPKSIVTELIQLEFTSIEDRSSDLSAFEIASLDSVDINYQLRGSCYAYSSLKNAVKSNGEAHSDNLPNPTDQSFPDNQFYLLINEQEVTTIDRSYLGCKLYLLNTTDSAVNIGASDSRLSILMEVIDPNGRWKEISYLPSSGCGNSYHQVVLDSHEFWDFDLPIFKGDFETKFRCKMYMGDEEYLYSNHISTKINLSQLNPENVQGYTSSGVMDPYSE